MFYWKRSSERNLTLEVQLNPNYCNFLPRGCNIHEKSINSELIPDIDIELIDEHSRMADQYDAIQSFIQKIRNNKPKVD